MTTISLVATDQLLSVALQPKVASGDKNSVELHVDFDSEWDGYGKSAVFFTEDNKTVYEVVMTDGNCVIPHEVLAKAGTLYIGVRGVNTDNAVKTSSLIKYRIVEGAPAGEGTTVEPTPDVYQQLMAAYGKTATSAEVANARVSALVASHSTGGAEVYRIDIDSDTKSYIKIESNGVVATAFINDYRPFNAREERMYTIPGRFAAHSIPHYEDIDNFTVSVSPGYGQPIDAAGIFARNNSDDDDAILMSTFTYNLDIIPIPAELADIRVRADGTTYETAGDAVRNNERAVNALRERVVDIDGIVAVTDFKAGYRAYVTTDKELRYANADNAVCTPENVFVHMNKGDKLEVIDPDDYEACIIYESNGVWVEERMYVYPEGEFGQVYAGFTAPFDGDYIVTVFLDALGSQGTIEEAASQVFIVKGDSLAKQVEDIQEQLDDLHIPDGDAVKTVNGIAPDENGNVVVEGASGGMQVSDDGKGNVKLQNVPTTDDDRIVEQGRSGSWDYRKWASGVAECWRTATATVKTTDWKDSGMMSFPLLSSFGLFWTKEMVAGKDIQFTYPFTFASRPVETACMTNGTVWFPLSLISTTGGKNDRTDSYRLCTYKVPEQDIAVTISFHVIGRWK